MYYYNNDRLRTETPVDFRNVYDLTNWNTNCSSQHKDTNITKLTRAPRDWGETNELFYDLNEHESPNWQKQVLT